MLIDKLPIGSDPPNEVNVVIEVPIGGEPIKYEVDKAAGILVDDWFRCTPMRYPGNYGFIPRHFVGGWRHVQCGRGRCAAGDTGFGHRCPVDRCAQDERRIRCRRKDHCGAGPKTDSALRSRKDLIAQAIACVKSNKSAAG